MHKNLSEWKLRVPDNLILFGEDVCDEDYDTADWIDTI